MRTSVLFMYISKYAQNLDYVQCVVPNTTPYLITHTISGCIGQGAFMLGLAFSGCNSTAAIAFSTIATAVSGAVSTGPLASFIDISPNFASELQLVNSSVVLYKSSAGKNSAAIS
jgi:hypothetical protein